MTVGFLVALGALLMLGAVIHGGKVIEGASRPAYRARLGSPALGTATAVHAAVTDTGSTITITTAITNPDVPRCIVATPGGTTANVTAVSCTITGTNIEGTVITEVLPAFSAGAATAVTSTKAFATVTSISQPAIGSAVTVSYGTSPKLGLPWRLDADTVNYAALNGVREATRPTVSVDATNIEKNLITLNSALNGNPVDVGAEVN